MEAEVGKETNKDSCKPAAQLTTLMEKIPREISFDMLSRLSITSLLQCKFVSRLWCTSVKDPFFASMHLSRAAEDNLCLILFSDWPRSKLHLVHRGDLDGDTEKIKRLNTPFESVLPDFDLVGSCNGLVCLYNSVYDDPLYIYNPFTIEYKELPKQNTDSLLKVCRVVFGFGFHPRTKDYKVIKIVYYQQEHNYFIGGVPEAFVLTFGTTSWRNLGKLSHQINNPASEALVSGNLHWLTHCHVLEGVKYRDIIAFDLETEEFYVIPRPSCGGLNNSDYHLVALGGCLSAVVSYRDGTNEIWMMKDYNVKESWTKEFVIRNYVPQGFSLNMVPPARIRKNGYSGRAFRVLCQLQNGEIVYLYKCMCLVSFNPFLGEFKDLKFQGLPLEFQTIVHMGSLISVEEAFGNQM